MDALRSFVKDFRKEQEGAFESLMKELVEHTKAMNVPSSWRTTHDVGVATDVIMMEISASSQLILKMIHWFLAYMPDVKEHATAYDDTRKHIDGAINNVNTNIEGVRVTLLNRLDRMFDADVALSKGKSRAVTGLVIVRDRGLDVLEQCDYIHNALREEFLYLCVILERNYTLLLSDSKKREDTYHH